MGRDGPASLDSFVRTVTINLIGTFNAIRVAATEMVKNDPNDEGERGAIVSTASVAALRRTDRTGRVLRLKGWGRGDDPPGRA